MEECPFGNDEAKFNRVLYTVMSKLLLHIERDAIDHVPFHGFGEKIFGDDPLSTKPKWFDDGKKNHATVEKFDLPSKLKLQDQLTLSSVVQASREGLLKQIAAVFHRKEKLYQVVLFSELMELEFQEMVNLTLFFL
jgi:hypothetical protein